MTLIEILLIILAIYILIGTIYGFRFVLSTICMIDPVASQAPLRVRLLFLPGTIAIWPIVILHARAKAVQISESAS